MAATEAHESPPLAGVRILDLSRLLPGPYGTMLLAAMGAEVIKVEEPGGGDPLRSMPPFAGGYSAHFAAVNRGKKSLALDLKKPAGREALLRLIPTADALLEGFRPGTAARLSISYDDLRPLNPRLVYCSLSGYGQTGPLSARAGHDANYLALAGALGLTGPRLGLPALPAVQVADLGGGMLAALGIVAGVLGARAGGQGRYLDASMFDLVFSWLGAHAVPCMEAVGEAPGCEGLPLTGMTACYRVYATRDGGAMSLAALEPRFWQAFCRAAARPDLEERQFDPGAIPEVEALFRQHTRAEWSDLLAGADACCEPVLGLGEAAAGDQVALRGLLGRSLEAEGTRFVRPPLGSVDLGEPPRLGQHTTVLLRGAGYGDDEIAAMAASGAAGI